MTTVFVTCSWTAVAVASAEPVCATVESSSDSSSHGGAARGRRLVDLVDRSVVAGAADPHRDVHVADVCLCCARARVGRLGDRRAATRPDARARGCVGCCACLVRLGDARLRPGLVDAHRARGVAVAVPVPVGVPVAVSRPVAVGLSGAVCVSVRVAVAVSLLRGHCGRSGLLVDRRRLLRRRRRGGSLAAGVARPASRCRPQRERRPAVPAATPCWSWCWSCPCPFPFPPALPSP